MHCHEGYAGPCLPVSFEAAGVFDAKPALVRAACLGELLCQTLSQLLARTAMSWPIVVVLLQAQEWGVTTWVGVSALC